MSCVHNIWKCLSIERFYIAMCAIKSYEVFHTHLSSYQATFLFYFWYCLVMSYIYMYIRVVAFNYSPKNSISY